MTHFPVAVILPEDVPLEFDAIDEALTKLLAPFDEQGEWGAEGTKWDWWVLGGRWRGELLSANGTKGIGGRSGTFDNPPQFVGGVDALPIGDIDWEGMYAARREVVRGWYQEIMAEGDRFHDVGDKTEEEYIQSHTPFRPQAILLDGEWMEPGEMGWFGIGSDLREDKDWLKKWEDTISKTAKNRILAIVDCHV